MFQVDDGDNGDLSTCMPHGMYNNTGNMLCRGLQDVLQMEDYTVHWFRYFLMQVWSNKWPCAEWRWWVAVLWDFVTLDDRTNHMA